MDSFVLTVIVVVVKNSQQFLLTPEARHTWVTDEEWIRGLGGQSGPLGLYSVPLFQTDYVSLQTQ